MCLAVSASVCWYCLRHVHDSSVCCVAYCSMQCYDHTVQERICCFAVCSVLLYAQEAQPLWTRLILQVKGRCLGFRNITFLDLVCPESPQQFPAKSQQLAAHARVPSRTVVAYCLGGFVSGSPLQPVQQIQENGALTRRFISLSCTSSLTTPMILATLWKRGLQCTCTTSPWCARVTLIRVACSSIMEILHSAGDRKLHN